MGPRPATYNDGRTAAAHDVLVSVGEDGLEIRDRAGAVRTLWPAGEVHFVDKPAAGTPLRLQRGFDSGERLTIAGHDLLPQLQTACPELQRTLPSLRRSWRPVAMWTGAAAIVLVATFWFGLPAGARWLARAVPPGIEQPMGAVLATQVVGALARRHGQDPAAAVCTGAAGQAVLERLLARLAAVADSYIAPQVKVVDLPIENAFALPGGQLLLFRGLLDLIEDPNALAGIMAHEMGHVVHRHPVQFAFQNAGAVVIINVLVGDFLGTTAVAGLTAILLTISYSRVLEAEADATGLAILNDAGLDGLPLAVFFAGLDDLLGGNLAWLSTHPPSGDRAAGLRAGATGRRGAFTDAEWQAVRAICD